MVLDFVWLGLRFDVRGRVDYDDKTFIYPIVPTGGRSKLSMLRTRFVNFTELVLFAP